MSTARHTPLGRRIRTSLGLAEATPKAVRCAGCFARVCDTECGRCVDCYRTRNDQVRQIEALVHIEPKISAADLMYRTGAPAPVVTAYLRAGRNAALVARESLTACTGSPMHVRDIIQAHHERLGADDAIFSVR